MTKLVGRLKTRVNLNNFVLIVGLLAILILLFWRFELGMSRYFDLDEFTHLYRSYLLADGKIPYKDFGYFYSPIFAGLFSPFFLLFKDQVAVLYLSRSLIFFIFLATLVLIYLIGKTASNSFTGLLAAFFYAFFPISLDKTLEIRPDNLAIPFWLISCLFLLLGWKRRRYFLAGLSFGFSILILYKTIIGIIGLLAMIFAINLRTRKNLFRALLDFLAGLLIPFAIFALILLRLGVLAKALYFIFKMPAEVTAAYGMTYFLPLFPFLPNDAFYGLAGKSLPWFLSNLIFVFTGIAFVKFLIQIIRGNRQLPTIFLFFSMASFWAAILFIYHVSLVQYYLPLIVCCSLASALFLNSISQFLLKKSRLSYILIYILILSVIVYGFHQSVGAHRKWGNQLQVQFINQLLAISTPDDHFFDMTGYHFFRPPSYFFCCEPFGEYRKSVTWKLPDLRESLKSTQTKFILQTPRLNSLSEEDKKFINNNFFPSGLKNMAVVGKKIIFSGEGLAPFEILTSGNFRLVNYDSNLRIDGNKITANEVYLAAGKHTASGPPGKEILLIYDFLNQQDY